MVEKITIRVYRRCVEPPFFRGIVRWNVISGKKKSCLEFCLKEFYKKIKVPRVCVCLGLMDLIMRKKWKAARTGRVEFCELLPAG